MSVSDSEMVGSRVEKGREEEGRERASGFATEEGVRIIGCGGCRDEERRWEEGVAGVARSARLCERLWPLRRADREGEDSRDEVELD